MEDYSFGWEDPRKILEYKNPIVLGYVKLLLLQNKNATVGDLIEYIDNNRYHPGTGATPRREAGR